MKKMKKVARAGIKRNTVAYTWKEHVGTYRYMSLSLSHVWFETEWQSLDQGLTSHPSPAPAASFRFTINKLKKKHIYIYI